MQMYELPAGVTAESIAAAMQFLANQAAMVKPRPSGLLPPNMIRGVNPNYQYVFREYPKALIPPAISVEDEEAEKALRLKWRQPLPWDLTNEVGLHYVQSYYARQDYPKRMTPPAVIVRDASEEASYRASWQEEFGDVVIYPMWMFHPTQQPILVSTREQQEALGAGWFPTIQEALSAAKGGPQILPTEATERERIERERLEKRAAELNMQYDSRIKTPLLRLLVGKAEKAAERAAEKTEAA